MTAGPVSGFPGCFAAGRCATTSSCTSSCSTAPPLSPGLPGTQRNRLVRAATFAAHCRRWRRRTATDPAGLIPGATSAVVLDRITAEQLQAIHLHPTTPRTLTPSH